MIFFIDDSHKDDVIMDKTQFLYPRQVLHKNNKLGEDRKYNQVHNEEAA
jgi:hypothetical protein